jgi:hypothetical protein
VPGRKSLREEKDHQMQETTNPHILPPFHSSSVIWNRDDVVVEMTDAVMSDRYQLYQVRISKIVLFRLPLSSFPERMKPSLPPMRTSCSHTGLGHWICQHLSFHLADYSFDHPHRCLYHRARQALAVKGFCLYPFLSNPFFQ